MFEKVKDFAANPKAACTVGLATLSTFALPMVALAEDQGNAATIQATLTTSFKSMADTMISTVTATLPVVMSVMSAYLCINFGIRFFKRFAK